MDNHKEALERLIKIEVDSIEYICKEAKAGAGGLRPWVVDQSRHHALQMHTYTLGVLMTLKHNLYGPLV